MRSFSSRSFKPVGGLIIAAALASATSCTALLGLDDKTFDLGGGGAGGGGGASITATGAGGGGGAGGAGGGTGCDMPQVVDEPQGTILWAKGSAGMLGDSATLGAVALDACGAVWIAGSFTGGVGFAGCDTRTTSADSAAFVAKLAPDGECQALFSFDPTGSPAEAYATGIAVGPDGGIVVAGNFRGTLAAASTQAQSQGEQDVFVLKLSSEGAPQWLASAGGIYPDAAGKIAIDAQGRVLVPAALGQSFGVADAAVLRYDPGGGPPALFTLDATGNSGASAVAVDPAGNVGVTGWVSGDITLGGQPMTLNNEVTFAALLTPGMILDRLWASAGNGPSRGLSVAFSGDGGALHAGGVFSDSFSLDPGLSPLVTEAQDEDGFVARIRLVGNTMQHARLTHAPGSSPVNERVEAVVAEPGTGDPLIAGAIQGPSSLRGTPIAPLSSGGGDDLIVARLGVNLAATVWGGAYGELSGSFDQVAQGAAFDPGREVLLVGGTFSGSLNLGAVGSLAAGSDTSVFVMAVKP